MFDLGVGELLVIGTVALVVVGPKDLPDMFRTLGRFTAKIRAMSREFSRAMDQAAKESGAAAVVKDLKNVTSARSMGLDAVSKAADRFEKWDPVKNAARPTTPTPLRSFNPTLPSVATVTTPALPARPQEPAAAKVTAPKTAPKPAPKTARKPAPESAPKQATAKATVVTDRAAETDASATAAAVRKPRSPRKPAPKGDAA